MIIRVTLEGKSFAVEIPDLNARPIVAIVEGERFEVWPDEGVQVDGSHVESSTPTVAQRSSQPHTLQPANAPTSSAVPAPLPGVIVAVSVQPGAEVSLGQELCVLEAMKMKNAIRAPRAGRIVSVHVAVGQTVKHRDVLVEYER
jgi:biotin carboxyl carrier protein